MQGSPVVASEVEQAATAEPATAEGSAAPEVLATAEGSTAPEVPATAEGPAAPEVPMTDALVAAQADTASRLGAVETLLATLEKEFNSKMRYDASKQQIIDRQHEELERYRQKQAQQVSRAIISDVISEADDAEKTLQHYRGLEPTPENFAKLLKLVEQHAENLRDLLERNDVFAYRCEPGSPFDARRQRAMRTVETQDPALAKTVQECVRWGYADMDDKVIRPEMVNVFVYKG